MKLLFYPLTEDYQQIPAVHALPDMHTFKKQQFLRFYVQLFVIAMATFSSSSSTDITKSHNETRNKHLRISATMVS